MNLVTRTELNANTRSHPKIKKSGIFIFKLIVFNYIDIIVKNIFNVVFNNFHQKNLFNKNRNRVGATIYRFLIQ